MNSEEKKYNLKEGEVVVRGATELTQQIFMNDHKLIADEPLFLGGKNFGPNPYEFLLTALGACTSMTLQIYSRQKSWPLEGVEIKLKHSRIHAKDCSDCESDTGRIDMIEREIKLEGSLTEEQNSDF